MKKSIWIFGAAWVLCLAGSAGAIADSAVNLALVYSDAVVDSSNRMVGFQLQATVDANGDLTGLTYYGNGSTSHYTLAQVRAGAVLKHDASHNLDVVTLYGPDIDPHTGGEGRLHYLINGLTGNSGDFYMEIQRVGSSWVLYTGRDNGSRQIHSLFMKKNVQFWTTVGIDHIEAN